jgi:hypothetical protein
MREMINVYRILVRSLKMKEHLKDLSVDRRIILK